MDASIKYCFMVLKKKFLLVTDKFYANIENKSEISFKLDPNLYNRL